MDNIGIRSWTINKLNPYDGVNSPSHHCQLLHMEKEVVKLMHLQVDMQNLWNESKIILKSFLELEIFYHLKKSKKNLDLYFIQMKRVLQEKNLKKS